MKPKKPQECWTMPMAPIDSGDLPSRISALEAEVKELREQVRALMDAHPKVAGKLPSDEEVEKINDTIARRRYIPTSY